jgi:hypothetical protein
MFKKGDKVVPRPGFSGYWRDSNYGGSGWADPEIMSDYNRPYLVIREVFMDVCFFEDWNDGIYVHALMHLWEYREIKIIELEI